MTLSMTGFAARKGQGAGAVWHWELRSVNGKGLDLRLPGSMLGPDGARSMPAPRHVCCQCNAVRCVAAHRASRAAVAVVSANIHASVHACMHGVHAAAATLMLAQGTAAQHS